MRLGDPPEFQHELGRPTKDYLGQLRKLPKLEDQGDGVRNYMGLILNMLAGHHDIILIDEPEAFLHPPQARLLARILAERASKQQLFLATHSTLLCRRFRGRGSNDDCAAHPKRRNQSRSGAQ